MLANAGTRRFKGLRADVLPSNCTDPRCLEQDRFKATPMANEEHVKILLAGRAAIWEWRKHHQRSVFDLRGANLTGANLRGANLSGANLRAANLIHADLKRAELHRANLSEANLSGANLIQANLSVGNLDGAAVRGAVLGKADLVQANLAKADLRGANFAKADLGGANLSETVLYGTVFADTKVDGANFDKANLATATFANIDLSMARNLETVFHGGASTIGLDTLIESRGKIPDVFLRGCGVPDDIIAYIPSLVGQVFDFYSSFISYSSRDNEFAERLHARLQQEKLRVWFAPEDIKAGRKLYPQIDEAIRLHEKLLLVLSVESMASEWVATEIRRARNAERDQKRQKLFPIRLCDIDTLRGWQCFDADSGKDLAVEVREYHIPDFSNWKNHDSFETAFKRLVRDLRKNEPTAPPAGAQDVAN
jgi:hypothetical protein